MRFSMFRPLIRARLAPRKFSPPIFSPTKCSFHGTSILRNDSNGNVKEPYLHLEAVPSPISAAHVQTQDLLVVDRILEPQTVVGFIGFLFGNPLPDGTRPSSIATLPMEDLEIIQGPNYLSSQTGPDSPSPLHRVMDFVGSWEDQSRLCGVGKNIQSLKSRLWSGITPLSDQRWKERRLHLRENFDQACQNLGAVVAVFEYLNVPEVQDNLRQTFNLMYDVWAEVDTVLNQRRAHIGEPPISIANLWTLYMSAHLDLITQRAHKWVTEHVDTLRAPFMQDILNHEPLFDGEAFPDAIQWELGDALHILLETDVRADHTIMIPMDGYKGYKAPETGGGPPKMYARNDDERGAAYSQRVRTLSHKIAMDRVIQQFSEGSKTGEVNSGKSLHESAMDQIDALRQVRRELRGNSLDLTLQEPWISSKLFLLKQMKEKGSPMQFGFVIYRLTYGQSDSEWLDFTSRMEKHISDWGAGQGGSDAIKPYLKLHWVDGRDNGIEENDIEAAKRHFNGTLIGKPIEIQDEDPLHTQSKTILAIDSDSYMSYMNNPPHAANSDELPVESTGFVLAIDPSFDPEVGIERADESPDYNGQMRVRGSLVWGDLYAILESQSAELPDLWPLAMHHPNQVYVGPVIPLQRYHWQAQKEGQ